MFHKVWLGDWIHWLQLELQISVTRSYTVDAGPNRNVCVCVLIILGIKIVRAQVRYIR